MAVHFGEIRIIADMVPDPVLLDILVLHLASGDFLGDRERLEDRHRVRLATADVVDLGDARRGDESCDECRHVDAMDVVADLLPL